MQLVQQQAQAQVQERLLARAAEVGGAGVIEGTEFVSASERKHATHSGLVIAAVSQHITA
jgi:hypothetical protein